MDQPRGTPPGSRLPELTRRADIRVITATNVDLEAAVKAGRFREDLFYRLNVVELRIPPLRDRPQDVIPMAERFLATFALQSHKTLAGFTDRAVQVMVPLTVSCTAPAPRPSA